MQVVRPRFLRSPVIVKIDAADVSIDKGFLTNTISWGSDGNSIKVVFSRRYNGLLTEIAAALGCRPEGIDSTRDRPRDLMRAAKGASGDEMKAELA